MLLPDLMPGIQRDVQRRTGLPERLAHDLFRPNNRPGDLMRGVHLLDREAAQAHSLSI